MTGEKILEVVAIYEKMMATHYSYITPEDANHYEHLNGLWIHHFGHLRTMPDKIRKFVAEGRIEKSFRWLGFMQGVLWANGKYTLDELMNHNRPAEDKPN